MTKQPNLHGGGAKTNANGLAFEQTTSLQSALQNAGCELFGNHIFREGEFIGLSVPKHALYKEFLEPCGIDYETVNSKKWLPDEALINEKNKTVYILEKKFQNNHGSVDEKLPNCHFKKMEYEKLCAPLGYKVDFIYILSDWFKNPQYRDTLDYVKQMGCDYFFNEIPLQRLGLLL